MGNNVNNKITDTEEPIMTWTLNNDDVQYLSLAQKYQMEVSIEFVSRLPEDANGLVRQTTIREQKGNEKNCSLHIAVLIEGLHRNISIALKRIPNRLLRAGNRLVINANREIFWKPEIERFRGAIISNTDHFFKEETHLECQ